LLAREHHFPATIADLYDSRDMPDDLRAANDRNDEFWNSFTSAAASRTTRNGWRTLRSCFQIENCLFIPRAWGGARV